MKEKYNILANLQVQLEVQDDRGSGEIEGASDTQFGQAEELTSINKDTEGTSAANVFLSSSRVLPRFCSQ